MVSWQWMRQEHDMTQVSPGWFYFFRKDGPVVTYGDDNKGKTKDFGTIKCKSVELKNVSYIKGLKHYLISINQLYDTDYEVYFNKKEGNIIDLRNLLFSLPTRKWYLCIGYVLCWFNPHTFCVLHIPSSPKLFVAQEAVSSELQNSFKDFYWWSCQRNAQDEVSQRQSLLSVCQTKTNQVLLSLDHVFFLIIDPFSLLYIDLFGPVPVKSRIGKRFTLVIVDEFSRFTWVLFLQKERCSWENHFLC